MMEAEIEREIRDFIASGTGVGYGRGGARDEDDVPFLVALGGDLGKSAGGFYGLFVRDGELRKRGGMSLNSTFRGTLEPFTKG